MMVIDSNPNWPILYFGWMALTPTVSLVGHQSVTSKTLTPVGSLSVDTDILTAIRVFSTFIDIYST